MDRWIRCTTTASVVLLAVIASVVSYKHMHQLVLRHGESAWSAALIPLSVDGMIVASSMSLLLASRRGSHGGALSWILLVISSLASLSANVAVAEPTLIGRIIAAWPSFALIGAYELFMAQIRQACRRFALTEHEPHRGGDAEEDHREISQGSASSESIEGRGARKRRGQLQRAAWEWALANRASDGALPSGKAIAARFARSARWGRLVKREGLAGEYG